MKLFKFEDKNKVRSVIILIICSIILAVYILCNSDRIIRHYNAYQNIGADVVGISGWHIVMAVLALEIYMVIISCLSVRTYKIFKNYKVGNNEDENRILVAILFLIIVVLLLILLEWAYWNIDLIRIAVFVITEDQKKQNLANVIRQETLRKIAEENKKEGYNEGFEAGEKLGFENGELFYRE